MYHQHLAGVFINTETIIRSLTYQPDDVFTATKYPLLFFLQEGELVVGHVVAYLFLSLHAERYESVALFPKA